MMLQCGNTASPRKLNKTSTEVLVVLNEKTNVSSDKRRVNPRFIEPSFFLKAFGFSTGAVVQKRKAMFF